MLNNVRASLMIFFPVLILCLLALHIGTQNPNPMQWAITVIATYTIDQSYPDQNIVVFDIKRNLPISVSLPDGVIQNAIYTINLSQNGRRAVISDGFQNNVTFIAWDIFSGEYAYIEPPDCETLTNPKWTSDDRQVFFNCYSGASEGSYFFDFATRILTTNPIEGFGWSPDGKHRVSHDLFEVAIFDSNGENKQTIIDAKDKGRFIAWEGDGESFLLRDIDTALRYTLATQSLEILADDVIIYQDMVSLSPDGQWLSMMIESSNPFLPHLYTLDLPTATMYDISSLNDEINRVGGMSWSLDSQWLFVTNISLDHYVIKPDASITQKLISENRRSIYQYWSLDSQWLAFTTFPDTYLYVWRWAEAEGRYNLFKQIKNQISGVTWSSNYDKLIFVQGDAVSRNRLAYLDMNTGEVHFISALFSNLSLISGYRLVE